MAKFHLVDGIYINIDSINTMYYNEKTDHTYIDMSGHDSICEVEGNLIPDILQKNNDVTFHERLLSNHAYDKLKSSLSLILARLDSISKTLKTLEGK